MVAACLFRGLGDPRRLTILQLLAAGEKRVTDVVQELRLAQSTVSNHLACLRDCGLVTSRPQGRATVWSLAHRVEVLQLFESADALLSMTGAAVALCDSFGLQGNHA